MRQRSAVLLMIGVGVMILLGGGIAALAQDGGTDTYTVQAGDVLDLIAAAYDVDTNCLAEANALEDPGELRVGQVLIISFDCPRYTGPAFVTNPREDAAGADAGQGGGGGADDSPAREAGPNDEIYVVQRGDTLDTIAQEKNVSLVSLRIVNDLTSPFAVLQAGDELIIPGDAPPYGQYPPLANPAGAADELGQGGGGVNAGPGDQVYVVQPFDVLDLIGADFDTQVACIAEANELSNPSVLYAGQTLVIPGTCPRYDGAAPVTNPRGGES